MSPGEVSQPILGNFIQGIKALGSLTQDTKARSQLGPDRWHEWRKLSWEVSILAPSPRSVMINTWPSPQDQGDKRTDGDPGNRAHRTHLKGQRRPLWAGIWGCIHCRARARYLFWWDCSRSPCAKESQPCAVKSNSPRSWRAELFYMKSLTLRLEQHISIDR